MKHNSWRRLTWPKRSGYLTSTTRVAHKSPHSVQQHVLLSLCHIILCLWRSQINCICIVGIDDDFELLIAMRVNWCYSQLSLRKTRPYHRWLNEASSWIGTVCYLHESVLEDKLYKDCMQCLFGGMLFCLVRVYRVRLSTSRVFVSHLNSLVTVKDPQGLNTCISLQFTPCYVIGQHCPHSIERRSMSLYHITKGIYNSLNLPI